MIKYADFIFTPEQFFNKEFVKKSIAKFLSVPIHEINAYKIVRKSIDARKNVKYNVRIIVATHKDVLKKEEYCFEFKDVGKSKSIIIVGAGPAGYFAALNCIMNGLKPIVLERGKPVEERKYDIAEINRNNIINPESNFAFGEGGAGTYSDGKLYTRSKKRGNVKQILELLNYFGAKDDILIDAQPHVGTDCLIKIVKNIRDKILNCGGEISFNTKVSELIIKDNKINGVKTASGNIYESGNVILATGHSARDVYYFLDNHNISMEIKDFAMGVRVEHPQLLIDKIQYKRENRGDFLPPANYSLVKQVEGRGVYSFCMCPGGIIVPAATNNNEIVVNGMSNSRRNSEFANSGIVVELKKEDFKDFFEYEKFAGLEFQKRIKKMAYLNSGRGLAAPAQRLTDFVSGKLSSSLPLTSYNPGLISSPMHFWLSEFIGERLKTAIKSFDKLMKGYLTQEAVAVGVESRTSSPVKIVRDQKTGEQINIKGLFPCGEGAGYAGGIISAAIDGMTAIENVLKK